MKEIKLIQLALRNFKGIRSFTLEADGNDVKVYGDNATGKTTLFDAFVWLLFDKDSNNRKDFAIKTLDENGKVLHNLEHEVEASFSIDGKIITLRKVYIEKWTQKRGSVSQEFSGHTTDYLIDGVPAKKKEYDQLISELIDEDVFKLLTNPAYFNEQLKWQDRRKVLLEVCGDVTDEEVIACNQDLAKLLDVLNGRSIEDHKKVIVEKRKEINKELDSIPVRIDEIQRGLPELTGLEKQSLENQINDLNTQIDDKMTEINSIKNGKAITDKQKEIQEVEIELLQIKQEHEAGSKDHVYQLKARLQEEKSNTNILQSQLEDLKIKQRHNAENIKSIEENLQKLREEWTTVNNQEFKHSDQCECPACGQSLPEEQIEEARNKALAQFNLEKSKKLEEINSQGKRGKEQKEELFQQNEQLVKKQEKFTSQIEKKQKLMARLTKQLEQLESQVIDITDNPQYVEKLQDKQKLQEEIEGLRLSNQAAIQEIEQQIIQLKSERDELQSELAKFSVFEQSQKRIVELQEQQRDLAFEFEQLEHELYLTEEFTRTKVNMLTEKINSKFKYARFKLFEQQVNGGLNEVCETLFNGVPYSSGLNNAAKINVGLDIINTLSEHYGFSAPIFVDNAEAVTKLIDTNSQLISLVVSGKDKQLRVETTVNEMKEAI